MTTLAVASRSNHSTLSSSANAAGQHVVKQGETLWGIAKHLGIPLDELLAANPQISNPNSIHPGQVLKVPAPHVEEPPAAEVPPSHAEPEATPAQPVPARARNSRVPPPVVNSRARDLASSSTRSSTTNPAPSSAVSSTAAASASPLDSVRQGRAELRRGATGAAVEEMQRLLTTAGYPLEVDGDFGPNTQAALKRFQTEHGIAATGALGKTTLGALDKATGTTAPTPVTSDALDVVRQGGTLQRGSTGAAVEALQRLLTAKGFPATVDGDFGPRTEGAVKDFQRSAGVTANGVVNAATLAALERNDPVRPGMVNPNDMTTSGCSAATARQDRVESGVSGSRKMAATDLNRVSKYKDYFQAAGAKYGIDPSILAAIASRESRGGNVLANGWGDGGNGYGLMQVDKRYHSLQGGPYSQEHVMQATGILSNFLSTAKREHPSWTPAQQLKAAISMYNKGNRRITEAETTDVGTTGGDYANDVIARAQYYKAQGF